MSRIADLKQKINRLTEVLEMLREKLKAEEEMLNNATTKTGKIVSLQIGRPYWIVGQRGQIYSVKLTPKNGDQLGYLNDMRRLFLSEAAAIEGRNIDYRYMRHLDTKDMEEELKDGNEISCACTRKSSLSV